MRHDKLEMQLQLLLALSQNKPLTVEELSQRFGLSRRNLYYYLDFYRDCGFIVEKQGPYYRIDRESPFFKQLIARISFSEEEAIALARILNKVEEDALVKNIKRKLSRFYDFDIQNDSEFAEQQARKVSMLCQAIKLKRIAVLKGYSSGHSQTKKDRLVEPYLMMNGNQDVRCHELSSGLNKTYKLSRMENVEILDDEWLHEEEHRQVYTDAFMFSGERQYAVDLRMGTLSSNLLREEYPASVPFIMQEDERHWLLHLPVCSYLGIGRFVLGLFEDIQVLGDEDFKAYLREKSAEMQSVFAEKE